MRAISRRLTKLEKVFAPVPTSEDAWGKMAEFRDELLRQAEQRGEPSVAELREKLEQLGPSGLWLETARGYLSDSPSKCRYLPRGYFYTATAVEGWFLKMPSRWAARTSLCSISAANNTA
jgi:hypothetical protein